MPTQIEKDATKQIEDIKQQLANHEASNNKSFAKLDPLVELAPKIDKLVELAPTIEEIVERQKAVTLFAGWIVKFITVISLIAGTVYAIVRIIKDIKIK